MTFPERGFEQTEFEERTARAQEMMHKNKLDALFLTTEPNVRYFSGFFTQFWKSPTRPWFLIVPAEGKPIAIIPEIGAKGMAETWIDDIHTWSSPSPEDDGISLSANVINDLPSRYGRIGATLGIESSMRIPFNNFVELTDRLERKTFVDIAPQIHRLRSVKSEAEVKKIQKACKITNKGFAGIPNHAETGQTEREICRQMRLDMIQQGADSVDYLIAGSGYDGYDTIIMGPADRILNKGDLLIIDTGVVYDGYFSDFDRNFCFGIPSDETRKAYSAVYDSTDAGFQAAKPGATTTDICSAMWSVLEKAGARRNDVGRMGHGLGMQLTEWPSITPFDNTLLVPGMVITLEPGMTYASGKSMVHEENIVITETGAEYLSIRCSPEIVILN